MALTLCYKIINKCKVKLMIYVEMVSKAVIFKEKYSRRIMSVILLKTL
jgi:hypothetical protein